MPRLAARTFVTSSQLGQRASDQSARIFSITTPVSEASGTVSESLHFGQRMLAPTCLWGAASLTPQPVHRKRIFSLAGSVFDTLFVIAKMDCAPSRIYGGYYGGRESPGADKF